MFTLNILFEIMELIISIIGLLLVVIGLILPFKQSVKLNQINQNNELEQEKRIWRMQLLDEQISKYYGPISAILREQTIIRQRIWYQIGRDVIFNNGKDKLTDLSPEEQLIWKHFIDKYKIPMQHRITEIMRDNAHLAIHGEHDIYVDQFLDYALGWELLDNQKKEGVPNYYEYYYCYNYPVGFNNYINNTLITLLKEKELLIYDLKK
ncbi:hypothetical protein B5E53_16960 [Eubacterium sp. An11]|uniref:hypothetical protein n=1 Tax=Eubacterium sp. An11 TaxID=1965542 RepID=UPI000B3A19D9|nr:hypothetical protein [Eubacterium sp. An11]OUQ62824.1 hypothetical protein B5E53_16960 [Eubacterium sp. An11]